MSGISGMPLWLFRVEQHPDPKDIDIKQDIYIYSKYATTSATPMCAQMWQEIQIKYQEMSETTQENEK